jgi:hypothetical protein
VQQHRNNNQPFTWWSSLRDSIQTRFWLFVPILYGAALGVCLVCAIYTLAIRRSARAVRTPETWPLLAVLAIVGSTTFVVACLNDCIETSRHIIVFQVATDFILLLGILELINVLRPATSPEAATNLIEQQTRNSVGIPAAPVGQPIH